MSPVALQATTAMDDEKAEAYEELASRMTELHASVALLTHNVEKMAQTDMQVAEMAKVFQQVFKTASAEQQQQQQKQSQQRSNAKRQSQ
ncbi:TPA: LOW QUALITY PROTEIN: hypothetical protein N0F65_004272 [Lagenidium giganteum]|uniref:Uncharacterized protein n=1 Tax=Lagenidium giganteum TaxID=4803 RepID=A0AAV2ZDX0_9STRA|nr:TPA: LOW QUALITY PROTEIN: hypothetical protein N0F65_004272 [Lagenidium giganteum]